MEPIMRNVEVKGVLTKSNLPVADYSVNPYVGCEHSCKYCYASFMKRFTNHCMCGTTILSAVRSMNRPSWSTASFMRRSSLRPKRRGINRRSADTHGNRAFSFR